MFLVFFFFNKWSVAFLEQVQYIPWDFFKYSMQAKQWDLSRKLNPAKIHWMRWQVSPWLKHCCYYYMLFFYKNNFIRTTRLKFAQKLRTTKEQSRLGFGIIILLFSIIFFKLDCIECWNTPNAEIDRIFIVIFSAWWSQVGYIWNILGVILYCCCSYECF